MTIKQLAEIANKLVEEGKGNYPVATLDFDINSYYVCKDALLLMECEGGRPYNENIMQ